MMRLLSLDWEQLEWQPRSDTESRAIFNAVARRDGEGARTPRTMSGAPAPMRSCVSASTITHYPLLEIA
jgi:hypothetical protein